MDNTNVRYFSKGISIGILALIFSTALGLAFIHISNFPYISDIDQLGISEASGLTRVEIMDNYAAVMDYLSPFSTYDFDLPTLKYSDMGASHFADCKVLFNGVYLAGAISGLVLFIIAVLKGPVVKKACKTAAFVTLFIPIVFSTALILNFGWFFDTFHGIFFEGDTWVFDPSVDEIINILPVDFFMHCALVIALFWALAALVLGAVGFYGCRTKKCL